MKVFTFLLGLILVGQHSFAQPAGTVIAFAGTLNKIPNGWILCDGQSYDRTQQKYKNLFDAIGTSWGSDAANKFSVPDLRGMFLRGVSDTAKVTPLKGDKEAGHRKNSRTDLNNPGNGGNSVGSKQEEAFLSHTHSIVDPGHIHFVAHGWSVQSGSNRSGGGELTTGGLSGAPDHNAQSSTTGISINETGGLEVRPKNAYVYYIIKL
jgi:microcystin-dependent protein